MNSNSFANLKNAAQAILDGNLFDSASRTDIPVSTESLLLDAWASPSPEGKLEALMRVLELDPQNQLAQLGVEWVGGIESLVNEIVDRPDVAVAEEAEGDEEGDEVNDDSQSSVSESVECELTQGSLFDLPCELESEGNQLASGDPNLDTETVRDQQESDDPCGKVQLDDSLFRRTYDEEGDEILFADLDETDGENEPLNDRVELANADTEESCHDEEVLYWDGAAPDKSLETGSDCEQHDDEVDEKSGELKGTSFPEEQANCEIALQDASCDYEFIGFNPLLRTPCEASTGIEAAEAEAETEAEAGDESATGFVGEAATEEDFNDVQPAAETEADAQWPAEDAERERIEEAQAEEIRLAEEAEAEAKRLEAEAEARRLEEAEAEAKRLAEEAEAEAKRLEADAEARRLEEAEAEAKRLAEEAEAEAKAKRLAEEAEAEAEAKRIAEEAEAVAKRLAEEEAQRRAAEAEALRVREEAKAEAQRAAEEAQREKALEEAAGRQEEATVMFEPGMLVEGLGEPGKHHRAVESTVMFSVNPESTGQSDPEKESRKTIVDLSQIVTAARESQSTLPTEVVEAEFAQTGTEPQAAPESSADVAVAEDQAVENEIHQTVKDIAGQVREVVAPEEVAPVAENPEASPVEDKMPLVLAVDDSPTIRKLVQMTLEREGFRVITAGDGLEALQLLSDTLPDIILSDVNMPRLDGYKLCRFVKKHDRTRHIPVVMLSGKDGVFDKLRGKMFGCGDYITKPFDSADLVEKVRLHTRVYTNQ